MTRRKLIIRNGRVRRGRVRSPKAGRVRGGMGKWLGYWFGKSRRYKHSGRKGWWLN